jgi:hypothetical protein
MKFEIGETVWYKNSKHSPIITKVKAHGAYQLNRIYKLEDMPVGIIGTSEINLKKVVGYTEIARKLYPEAEEFEGYLVL